MRFLRSGYRCAAVCCVPHGPRAGVRRGPTERMVRKGLLRGARVASTATDKEITRAYRKLAKQYHPDANPGARTASRESRRLRRPGRRRSPQGVRRGSTPRAHGRWLREPRWLRGGDTTNFRVEDLGDLGDLFGGIFGGRGGDGAPAAPARCGPGDRACTSPSKTPCGRDGRRQPPGRLPLPHLWWERGGPGDRHAHLRPLVAVADPRRQPGPLLALDRLAPSATAGAPLSTRRARPATGPAPSGATAR